MKNNAITFILLICLLTFAACSYDHRTSADTANVISLQETRNTPAPTPPTNFADKSEQTFTTVKVTSKEPLVWIGSFSADDLKTPEANDSIWNNGDYNEITHPEYIKIGTAIEVDVMNCAGYLISGKLNYVDALGWRLETLPGTAAADAIDRIQRCERDSEFPDYSAFAIAPRTGNRSNIKIGSVNTKKLYASLPLKSRRWLEEDKKIYKFSSTYRRKEKENLTLQNDNWTDTDGDGKIDLVEISAVCEKDDSEGTSCSSILMLIGGKWIEVGST